MKTKEFEIWVEQSILEESKKGYYLIARTQNSAEDHLFQSIKARLRIELPEQKIEITERQLDAAFESIGYFKYTSDDLNKFKKSLGFKE